MLNLPPIVFLTSRNSIKIGCSILLLACTTLTAQEAPLTTSQPAAPEQQALRVLNDSELARTVKPTLQDAPCTYQHPAFPGLFPEDKGALIDATAPDPHSVVKPDTSEYLIRFQSVKPVQGAIRELLAIGEKWSAYGPERPVSASDSPTDVANAIYNVADMITVAVILKHPGPEGTSLFDYGYEQNGRGFPSRHFRVWPCAGLRTSNGQVFAHVAPSPFGRNGYKAMQLSFPRLIDGKLLISNPHEKVEFRLVVNQRVFETTFYVDASDVLDGSESSLYLPSAFTDVKEFARVETDRF